MKGWEQKLLEWFQSGELDELLEEERRKHKETGSSIARPFEMEDDVESVM